MDADNKLKAEAVLRDLLLGAQVIGVRWYYAFMILLQRVDSAPADAPPCRISCDELVLTAESRWTVFDAWPSRFPDNEEELPIQSLEEQVGSLARLGKQSITDVTLGDRHPHLIISFDSGRVFFLNGYHEHYESWNLTTFGASEGQDWLVVAVPGSSIAIFDPKNTVIIE